jgi:hypothetical protein
MPDGNLPGLMRTTNWIDRVFGPEGRLRIPWWVWVPAGWILTALILQATKWIDGSTSFPQLHRAAITDPFYLVMPLAGYAYLTRAARRAFDRFTPAMDASEQQIAAFRHHISSLSPRTAWITLVVGGVIGAGSGFGEPETYELMTTSVLTTIVWGLVSFVSFGLHVVLAALIVRQLRLVARLHREAAHIDLFLPEPVHAFASLTARAGTVTLALAMYSAATDPTTFTNPVWRWVFIVAMVLAATAFFLPLAGLSRRLRAEKRSLTEAASARLSALTGELHEAIDTRHLDAVVGLQAAIGAVTASRDRVKKMSAWPWETATIRGFTTTLLVPITTWFITSLLGQSLGL